MWDAIVEAMYQFAEATETAEAAHREIQTLLPKAKRRPLIAHARAVCLAAGKPLREDVLLQKAFGNGYVSRRWELQAPTYGAYCVEIRTLLALQTGGRSRRTQRNEEHGCYEETSSGSATETRDRNT